MIDPNDLITAEDLVKYTGFSQPGLQCKWLSDHGIRFITNKATGRPCLSYEALTRQLANPAPERHSDDNAPRLHQI